jgi:glycosyltransferase involved in cell wall biosynthesis
MITLIVPTRNRAHTLRLVGETFYRQEGVSEIIFIDDAGTDDSPAVIAELAARFPEIPTQLLRNEERRGAAFSRTRGYKTATNAYIMYCDDDVYLEPGYARTCLDKLEKTGASIVSGRLVHKRASQSWQAAIEEFGYGTSRRAPFKKLFCEFRIEAKFRGDLTAPLTHSVIVTPKELLEKYGYDSFYARGNGYREESDFQLNAFVNGHTILVTNDVHCVELSRQENPSGGQRVGRLQRLFWAIYYTNYFYRKYYSRYAERLGLPVPRHLAIAAFALYQVHVLFIKPWSMLPGRLLDRLATMRQASNGPATAR